MSGALFAHETCCKIAFITEYWNIEIVVHYAENASDLSQNGGARSALVRQ